MNLPRNQSGVALITAILIVALATIWVSSIVWLDHLQQRRVASLVLHDQATLYALGAESWAHDILQLDLENGPTDHLSEEWAIPLPPLPVDGGQIQGSLEDMQGRFNVNNLVTANGTPDEIALDIFRRLLESLQIDPAIAMYVLDWVDPDVDTSFPDGAEDDVYTSMIPPYRTGNGPMTSITELRAIKGIAPEIYAALAPHVAALPIGTTININTATAEVLAALSDRISLFDAQSMADGRIDAPFDSLEEIRDDVSPQVLQQLSVASNFFRASVLVSLGTMRLSMYSLLERDEAGMVGTRLRSYGAD
ncbi:MAG: type II secretion system minor pseudopilin GspK [Gammaproteobacteria bacterium]|nr:type II secretion system minor pseudopilin GspK [Gammaproteobacteria bacterium]NNF61839.1 type II secretion system minor pseudopilin GspK [Gammaproteobacteria bacterium]